jgi:hypothetical protein
MDKYFNINDNTRNTNNNCNNCSNGNMNETIHNHFFQPNVLNNTNSDATHLRIHGLNNQTDFDKKGKLIDTSTNLRNSIENTNEKKKELNTRIFPGAPYMGRGQGILENTDINSRLNFGEDTRTSKSNNITSSYSANNFIPLVPQIAENIQNPEHIIPTYWVRGGMSTRTVLNNIDYLKSCGFRK